MGRIKGVSTFSVNFEPTGQAPFDARLLVDTKSDLYSSYPDNNFYEKMIVTVADENAQYILIDVNKRNTEQGWKRIDFELESRVSQNEDDIAQLRADFEGQNQRLETRIRGV